MPCRVRAARLIWITAQIWQPRQRNSPGTDLASGSSVQHLHVVRGLNAVAVTIAAHPTLANANSSSLRR
jgi:hypothetical protein